MIRVRGGHLPQGVVAMVAAGLVATSAGCASAPLPPPRVIERAQATRSYTAQIRVSLKGPSLRGRGRVLVAFERPDALRIEVPGPAGARLVAVARAGELAAVFPAERAVFKAEASATQLDALLGVALSPEEIIDLLVGVGSPRLRSYRAKWAATLPRAIEATLPDGTRLKIKVERATAGVDLPPRAFAEPAHEGYRPVDAEEARRLGGGGDRS